MPQMTVTELAGMGGQARAKVQGPKSLRGIGSLGYLGRCVTEVCNRMDELSEDDKERIENALYGLDGAS
jgi:hypothetical protein